MLMPPSRLRIIPVKMRCQKASSNMINILSTTESNSIPRDYSTVSIFKAVLISNILMSVGRFFFSFRDTIASVLENDPKVIILELVTFTTKKTVIKQPQF